MRPYASETPQRWNERRRASIECLRANAGVGARCMGGAGAADMGAQDEAGLLDLVEDGVVGTDADFCITQWNLGAEQLYGYPAAEVLGLPASQVATFTGDEQREQLERELRDHGRSRVEITA